jgi:protein-L-isoaspartate(D-aspartate) O-methyltransferase
MVKQQIQPWNVSDARVLSALMSLRREDFVPEKYRILAYADWMIPLSRAQKMLTPGMEGKLLQALQLKKTDLVLEIGTGTGYFSALLGKLAHQVVSVDLFREFSDMGALNSVSHGVNNIVFQTGDASRGWSLFGKDQRPFDAIIFTGSLPTFPERYTALLSEGGRLVVGVGESPSMQVIRVTRADLKNGSSVFHRESLFDTVLPRLIIKKEENLS